MMIQYCFQMNAIFFSYEIAFKNKYYFLWLKFHHSELK